MGTGVDAGMLPPITCDPGTTPIGSPVMLASSPQASSIAIDRTSVYWVVPAAPCQPNGDCFGTVNKMSICGGPTTVLEARQPVPVDVATDGVTLFWANIGTAGVAGSINRVSVNGGGATLVTSDSNSPVALALDASGLYWGDNTGGLFRSSVGPGGSRLSTSRIGDVATDGVNVAWTAPGPGTVFTLPVRGDASMPIMLASRQARPIGVSVRSGNVYWANNGDGTIMKVPVTGGTPVMIASGQSGPGDLATDDHNVYWTTQDGTIARAPLDGSSAPKILASGQSSPNTIVVDTVSIYWVNGGDDLNNGAGGSVMKLTPR